MKSIFLPGLALLLSLTSTTLAQENQEPAQPLGADSEFRTLHNLVISAVKTRGKDGKRRVNSALYTWQIGKGPKEKFTRVDTPK